MKTIMSWLLIAGVILLLSYGCRGGQSVEIPYHLKLFQTYPPTDVVDGGNGEFVGWLPAKRSEIGRALAGEPGVYDIHIRSSACTAKIAYTDGTTISVIATTPTDAETPSTQFLVAPLHGNAERE